MRVHAPEEELACSSRRFCVPSVLKMTTSQHNPGVGTLVVVSCVSEG